MYCDLGSHSGRGSSVFKESKNVKLADKDRKAQEAQYNCKESCVFPQEIRTRSDVAISNLNGLCATTRRKTQLPAPSEATKWLSESEASAA